MSSAQQRRLSWALRLLALLAFMFATLSSTATAPAGAAAYGYDNLSSESSREQRTEAAGAPASQHVAPRQWSVFGPAERRGTSTTPDLLANATNTATGWLDDAATAKLPSAWGPGVP